MKAVAFAVCILSASFAFADVPTDKEAADYKAAQIKALKEEIKKDEAALTQWRKADLATVKEKMQEKPATDTAANTPPATAPKDDKDYSLNAAGCAFNDPSCLVGMKLKDAEKKLDGKAALISADNGGFLYDLSNGVIDQSIGQSTHYKVTTDKDKVITGFSAYHP